MIPKTMSEHDSISRTITRKGKQDNRTETQLMLIHFIGPHPNQLMYLHM